MDHLTELGQLVTRKRLEMGFTNRHRFAEAVGLSARVLGDLERGVRRLTPRTYSHVEQGFGWPKKSIDSFLEGERPIELFAEAEAATLEGFSDVSLLIEMARRLGITHQVFIMDREGARNRMIRKTRKHGASRRPRC